MIFNRNQYDIRFVFGQSIYVWNSKPETYIILWKSNISGVYEWLSCHMRYVTHFYYVLLSLSLLYIQPIFKKDVVPVLFVLVCSTDNKDIKLAKL